MGSLASYVLSLKQLWACLRVSSQFDKYPHREETFEPDVQTTSTGSFLSLVGYDSSQSSLWMFNLLTRTQGWDQIGAVISQMIISTTRTF